MYLTVIKTEKDKDRRSIIWGLGENMEGVGERESENGYKKEMERVK